LEWALSILAVSASTGASASIIRFATAAVVPLRWPTCQRGTKRRAASNGSSPPTVSRKVKALRKWGPAKGSSWLPTTIVSSSVVSMNLWHSAKRSAPEAEKLSTDSAAAIAQPSEGRSA